MRRIAVLLLAAAAAVAFAQRPTQPDWNAIEAETLRYCSEPVKFDTSDRIDTQVSGSGAIVSVA